MDTTDSLFIAWSLLFHVTLVIHFALRKWAFTAYTMRFGWIAYALSLPALVVSIVLLRAGEDWAFWVGGFLYVAWAIYGFTTEYVLKITWRNPIRWSIAGPYLTLYLATVMFYWWPVGSISRPLWYAYAGLFLTATVLNVASHRPPASRGLGHQSTERIG
jgi:hypothetical protein